MCSPSKLVSTSLGASSFDSRLTFCELSSPATLTRMSLACALDTTCHAAAEQRRIHLVEPLAQELEGLGRLVENEAGGAGHRAGHARAFFAVVPAGFGTRVDEAVVERKQIGRVADAARQHDGAAVHDGLRGEGERGGVAVDRLVLQRGQHGRRVHRRDADVLLDVEAAAVCDQPLPGVDDAADALDADGLAFHRLGALGDRRALGDPGGVGDVLAQHQFDQRTVDEIGDCQQPLALRGRPQEDRPGAHGKIGAAGDHGVDRAHAHDVAMGDLETFFLVEAGILGDEGRAEGQRRGRQRHHDLHVLAAARGGAEPNRNPDGHRRDPHWPTEHGPVQLVPFEHGVLPPYRSCLKCL